MFEVEKLVLMRPLITKEKLRRAQQPEMLAF